MVPHEVPVAKLTAAATANTTVGTSAAGSADPTRPISHRAVSKLGADVAQGPRRR